MITRPDPVASGGRGAAPEATAPGIAPFSVARLVRLDPGFYAFGLSAGSVWPTAVSGFAVPAVQVATSPTDNDGGQIEITDSFGRAGAWLGGRHRMLFVKAPAGGGSALVTAYLARDLDTTPLEVEVRRLASAHAAEALTMPGTMPAPVLMTLKLGDPNAGSTPQRVRLDIVAHIRSRGDMRFIDTPWVGRAGAGLWIEAFTVVPRDTSLTTALEYKGLTAQGAETPWIGGGTPCGTTGRGLPLIGFAVRQKAGIRDMLLDCEYSGYFQSGAVVGPSRNGAPCRSTADNDPLEGIQLRVIKRPPRPTRRDPS
ncbi:MAG TPA: hypothetical protein VHY35_23550 [Stellaceae bacterium]|jgi:hypothetical protein|nr:hypothetical protein [Stellaceae bacterium]